MAAIDYRGARDSGRQIQQQYQEDLVNWEKRRDTLKAKRRTEFHEEVQRTLIERAHQGLGRLVWANNQLRYTPGADKKATKIELWNEFSKLANEKGLTLHQETFDALYDNFKATQNDLFLQSFRYAVDGGMTEKAFRKEFRDNPRLKEDFIDVEATGFAPDDIEKLDFSAWKPDGSYMRHGDDFMGKGAWAEWMGENPWTTAGIGAGILGAGYLGRKPLGSLLSRVTGGGIGGVGTLGAFAAPSVASYLGASPEVQKGTRALSDAYLIKKAYDAGVTPTALKNLPKTQLIKSIAVESSDDLRKTAKALNVKVGKKTTDDALRKKLFNKIEKQTFKQSSKQLAKAGGKSVMRRLGTISGKAIARQAGGSVAPGIGNLIMAGWSAADLAMLGIDVLGLGKKETVASGINLEGEEADEFRKIISGQYKAK